MEKKKLEVTEEQRLFLEQMRETLAGMNLDDSGGVSYIDETGGCGAQCKVTCAHYCRANCDEMCDGSCYASLKGGPLILNPPCFWFRNPVLT